MAQPVLTDAMWDRASLAHGWYDHDEACLLFGSVNGPWCEIGCWKGRSTAVLAQTGFPGYAIDTFRGSTEHDGEDTYQEFLDNMGGFDNVTVIRAAFQDTADRVPGGLSLLHLDAEHTYESTLAAFELYEPKVAENGKVAVHDAWQRNCRWPIHLTRHSPLVEKMPWPGVTRFALELCEHPDWKLWDTVSRLAVFERR